MIRFGGRFCLRKSLVSNHRAAFVFRWICTISSSTYPSWINGAPEIALLAMDGDDDFVEMPNVVAAWRLSLQAAGVIGAEFDRPASVS